MSVEKRLDAIERTQKEILKSQKKLLQKEAILESDEEALLAAEKKEFSEEKNIDSEEMHELEQLKRIENIESKIKKEIKDSPLKRVTYRDVTKGMIGAFFGIVSHFAFTKGTELGEHLSFGRATLLLITSIIIIIVFLYFAGFRKVDEHALKIMPIRALVIFVSAVITILLVLLLYDKINLATPFSVIYNDVAAISVLAVLGAATADLIGRHE